MCGIYGAAFSDARPVEEADLRRALDLLRHRGPDADGAWAGPGIGLAACRLSVIDPSAGPQPVWNETRTVAVVANGEIYNHEELRKRLARKAHRFATRTDTEVLVHLYEEEGTEMTAHLDGMYAFAIWDAPKRRLFLARDPFGVKPLYYVEAGDGVVFASEPAPLSPCAGPSAIDMEALQLYFLLGHIPHPHSIRKGVRKLPPGASYSWEEGRGRLVESPLPRFSRPRITEMKQAVEVTRAALAESVAAQMAADVPVGVLLSGGIDSGLLAAAAAKSRKGLKTFSVGFADAPVHDETPHARAVAAALGTVHREGCVAPPDREALSAILARFGEPFADSSAIAMHEVSRLAGEEVTVVLSGEGGDELFGGYAERYVWDGRAARIGGIPAPLVSAARMAGSGLLAAWPGARGKNVRRRWNKLLSGARLPDADRYLHWFALFPDGARREMLGAHYRSVGNPFAGAFAASAKDAAVHRLMAADLAVTLPSDMLAKSDRMSMAHGLELRVPFLSRAVWEAARAIDPVLKVRGRQTKAVLRELAWTVLPPEIVLRPKHGFEVPVAGWMRDSWKGMLDELCEGEGAAAGGILQKRPLRALRERLVRGDDHAAHPLYAALAFMLWQERAAR